MSKLREYLEERNTGTVWASEVLQLLTEEEGDRDGMLTVAYMSGVADVKAQLTTLREQVWNWLDVLERLWRDGENSDLEMVCSEMHDLFANEEVA